MTRDDYNYRRNFILVVAKMAERESFLTRRPTGIDSVRPLTGDVTPAGRDRRRRTVAMVILATIALMIGVGVLLNRQMWRFELLLPLLYMYLGFLMMVLTVEIVDVRDGSRLIAFLGYVPPLIILTMKKRPYLSTNGWSVEPAFVVLLAMLAVVVFVFVMSVRGISADDALKKCGGLTEAFSIGQCEHAARAYRNRLALIEGMLLYLVGSLMLAVLVMPVGASR